MPYAILVTTPLRTSPCHTHTATAATGRAGSRPRRARHSIGNSFNRTRLVNYGLVVNGCICTMVLAWSASFCPDLLFFLLSVWASFRSPPLPPVRPSKPGMHVCNRESRLGISGVRKEWKPAPTVGRGKAGEGRDRMGGGIRLKRKVILK